jgi:phosphoglycerate dehydrogenase-like enzyme
MARLAKAYGMNVIALKRKRRDTNTENDPFCDVIYYSQEEAEDQALNRLCAASDYIFVAAPLTPETTKLIGKEQFDVMKSTAVIINVGRGPVIDEEAMIEALKNQRIKGAGLDVFTVEPLPADSPLWKLHNVLLSP